MHTRMRVAVLAVACLGGLVASGCSPTQGPEADEQVLGTSTGELAAPVSLDHNRNRLLSTLARIKGYSDRCSLWNSFTNIQRGVFLTHTDMLGNRSCMENSSIYSNGLNSGGNCDSSAPCNCAAGSDQALDHVFKVWSVNGNDPSCYCAPGANGYNCCNGGSDWHRTYFGADDKLIGYLRNYSFGLPEWGGSGDVAGAHAPFTNESETAKGSPRGQAQFWSYPSQASTLNRPGVVGVYDSQIVELDNDYNWLHDSNPEGEYSGTYGRAVYKRNWDWGEYNNTVRGNRATTNFRGNGQPGSISELDQWNYGIAPDDVWSPTCIGASISEGGVVNASNYSAYDIHPNTAIAIFGANFWGSGQVVYIRTRSNISAVTPMYQSASQINAQVPWDSGTGEAYVYVMQGSAITNVIPITINP
jgi:hypothetical protein